MDRLYRLLHKALLEELTNMSIGYGLNEKNLDYMNELVHAIIFLEDPKTNSYEGISILNRYVLFE